MALNATADFGFRVALEPVTEEDGQIRRRRCDPGAVPVRTTASAQVAVDIELQLCGQRQQDPREAEREGHGYISMLRGVSAAVRGKNLEHPWHTHEDAALVFDTLDAIRSQLSPHAANGARARPAVLRGCHE